MQVGNLVKPNLRIRNMRYFKGLVGVVVKVCELVDSAEPHCYIQWSGQCKLAPLVELDAAGLPVLTCCRYVEVIA